MLDQYEIIKTIGGSGTVLQAKQRLVDRIVAIKCLSESVIYDETSLKRFQREAQIASSLDHPNIAKVYSFGITSDKGPYLVMEYLEGKTLTDMLKESGRLSLEVFRHIFIQVCRALEYAHDKGIIHRDIKPGNIMLVSKDGTAEQLQVKLLDFGIAKRIDDQSKTAGLTQTGIAVGTPLYMSPEQCCGNNYDRRSDIYSLGCVMYEALCGTPPFTGENPATVMLKQLNDAAPEFIKVDSNLRLPPSLIRLIYQCLSKLPESRPQSAREVADKIAEACLENPEKVRHSSHSRKIFARNWFRILIAVLAISGLSMAALSALSISQKELQKRKIAKQRKEIEKSWARIDDLLEKANQDLDKSNFALAKECFQKTLQYIQNLPTDQKESKRASIVLFSAYRGLAKVASGLGEPPQKFLDSMLLAIEFAKKAYGTGDELVPRTIYDLATNLADSRSFLPQAEKLAKEVIDLRETNLRNFSKQLGSDEIAMLEHRGDLCILQSRYGAAFSLLGYIEMNQGKDREALKNLQKSFAIETDVSGNNDSTTLWTMYRLCFALEKCNLAKQEDSMVAALLQQFDAGETELPAGERQWMLYKLIDFFNNRNEYKRKKLVAETLVRMSQNDFGEKAPETERAKTLLKNVLSK